MTKLRVGLIQMKVVDNKDKNLSKAKFFINKAVNQGAELIVLPEMFNSPYQNDKFPEYAESERGRTWQLLSEISQKKEIILVGGSIPEVDQKGNLYNTSFIFDKSGKQVGKHRKIHLFDIDVEGGQTFKESNTLSAGDSLSIIDTPYGKIGVIICYDFRFPELTRLLVDRGADIIVVPGAFNMTTGPAHWEVLFRNRAIDNQVYTIGVAPARDEKQSYVSYGNSLLVSPWGKILRRLNGEEDIIVTDIDLNKVEKVRKELPLLKHRQKEIYDKLQEKK